MEQHICLVEIGCLAIGLGVGFPLGILFNWKQVKAMWESNTRAQELKNERTREWPNVARLSLTSSRRV